MGVTCLLGSDTSGRGDLWYIAIPTKMKLKIRPMRQILSNQFISWSTFMVCPKCNYVRQHIADTFLLGHIIPIHIHPLLFSEFISLLCPSQWTQLRNFVNSSLYDFVLFTVGYWLVYTHIICGIRYKHLRNNPYWCLFWKLHHPFAVSLQKKVSFIRL